MTSSSVGHQGLSDKQSAPTAPSQSPHHSATVPTTTDSTGLVASDAADAAEASTSPTAPAAPQNNSANGSSTTTKRPTTPANSTDVDHAHSSAQDAAAAAQTPVTTQASAYHTATPTASASQLDTLQQTQDAAMTNTGHYTTSTPFTPVASSGIDHHAYMMMALASMSNAPSAMSPPPTVTPSQVTLPNPMDATINGLAPSNAVRPPGAEKGLESFARIEFADSVFQMTTYAVIIGRDQRAMEQARRDEKRADVHKRRVEENASRGLPPPSPMMHDRSKFSKSYVSEEGGMLGPESDSEESGRPAKRRKTSTAGSSQQENEENPDNIISNRQYVSHTPGAAAVDLTSLRPSPWHVPFIGIHSPGPNIASKTKAISREHLKIAYNQQEGVFEAIPLHKNGFFCEDVHYKSEKVILKCGDRLQIKDIDFRFIINGVEKGRTGAEEYLEEEKKPIKKRQTHGGKEMSFEFEQTHGNGQIQETSDELSDVDGSLPELSDLGEDGYGDEEMAEEDSLEGEEAIKNEAFGDQSGLLMPGLPKKRGPGRPPKNGIMSKREQRLLKKQQQEMAKKTLPLPPPVEPPIKRKVGRPRKHPLPENAGDQPEKRKYKPRKPREDGAEGSDAERRAREKKEKKTRPKSPPLELKIEDYTEEQLQKPNKNYGVLIDETLTAAGPDGLTLKQIYKRICQRYPWFYFHTETKGWESSVRHNLIGNEAFKKDETTNLWSRVPGVELDAGKKRKASSPDRTMAAQGYEAPAKPIASGPSAAVKPSPGPSGTPQPQPAAAGKAPASSASPAAIRPVIEPRLLQAVVGLKNGLVDNLKKARNPKAEAIVMSALNRCVGLKKEATENDKMEAICIKGIRQVIDGFTKNKSPTPGGTAPNDPPPIFDAKVLSSLNGFKEVSIKALKVRLGEAKAEAVTLSAIDRVLGFVEASILPPSGEGETSSNFEGVEQHLMKSIRQLLMGMNQKLGQPA
ncbi:Forkhead box protein I1 [Beauveria bassiana]|uniref:Forkhead box protein I1 n=1 Tax=Beauveria bassiana TaxID=176275 RepID=A0A2N6NYX5_BEABA|nr:Forkhead box protein I1 [Beauveria bassiana]